MTCGSKVALCFPNQVGDRGQRGAIVVTRRDNAPAQEFLAVGSERDDLDLRPAQVDAEAQRRLQSLLSRRAARP